MVEETEGEGEHEDNEDPNSFHGFAVDVQEETVDAGAVDNSDDSDYEPPDKLREIEDEHSGLDVDNTSALLEAAALAEQTLTGGNLHAFKYSAFLSNTRYVLIFLFQKKYKLKSNPD